MQFPLSQSGLGFFIEIRRQKHYNNSATSLQRFFVFLLQTTTNYDQEQWDIIIWLSLVSFLFVFPWSPVKSHDDDEGSDRNRDYTPKKKRKKRSFPGKNMSLLLLPRLCHFAWPFSKKTFLCTEHRNMGHLDSQDRKCSYSMLSSLFTGWDLLLLLLATTCAVVACSQWKTPELLKLPFEKEQWP